MEKKKRNNKYICCFFTIWKLKSRLTDKSGQVVLSRTSVYFVSVISYCHFYILFMHHALSFPTFIFTLNVPRFPFYLIDRNRQQVLLIKWAIIFLRLKFFFFALLNFLKMVIFTFRCLSNWELTYLVALNFCFRKLSKK